MNNTKFLFPFSDKKNQRIFSSVALLIFTILVIVLFLLSNNLFNIFIIYLGALIFFLSIKASIVRTIRLIIPASVLIFFLGIPSLFLKLGEVIYSNSFIGINFEIYSDGLNRALFIWVRGIFSVSVITLYTTCVTMQQFIQSLRSLFIPNIIVTIILLMLRYTPLLVEEGENIRTAQKMRGLDSASRKRKFQAAAALMGGILIKSIKHGTEVYEAMVLRGLEDNLLIKRERVTIADFLFLIFISTLFSLISGGIIQKCIMK
ncbi:MAG: energy-coupling factor transporter transmembrane protein EcfT [Candidatus Heimdallarchaeum aukensis]|uniref:Energy-coupling factor transporter transmembrane protein EcfT n=1 Tax=Candidatus Heimdallarchaeum aukensis TaxID=2876573 RepID=A0A9Y1FLG1_9ARCH|nr:MAG: energy-coupling factor transporter transmembrane protein EcfT [Candidatus Heimdallarchaeum aukensis]